MLLRVSFRGGLWLLHASSHGSDGGVCGRRRRHRFVWLLFLFGMTTETHQDTGGGKGRRRRRREKCHSLFLGVATPLVVFHSGLLSVSGRCANRFHFLHASIDRGGGVCGGVDGGGGDNAKFEKGELGSSVGNTKKKQKQKNRVAVSLSPRGRTLHGPAAVRRRRLCVKTKRWLGCSGARLHSVPCSCSGGTERPAERAPVRSAPERGREGGRERGRERGGGWRFTGRRAEPSAKNKDGQRGCNHRHHVYLPPEVRAGHWTGGAGGAGGAGRSNRCVFGVFNARPWRTARKRKGPHRKAAASTHDHSLMYVNITAIDASP